ncbi:hypothetical protein [Rhodococcus sp. AG1013]|uniref:hypothetical protein n=1 Tax=Rhodococcus sp. AG1013 TaxID=2183996 RepID=UPI0011C0420F|nr:hypothetical protein [Rhodococcus sp. AG1013]
MTSLRNTLGTTGPTKVEIDVLFKRAQSIGNAIHALAEAELIVAAVDAPAPDTQAKLSQILRRAIEEADGRGQGSWRLQNVRATASVGRADPSGGSDACSRRRTPGSGSKCRRAVAVPMPGLR